MPTITSAQVKLRGAAEFRVCGEGRLDALGSSSSTNPNIAPNARATSDMIAGRVSSLPYCIWPEFPMHLPAVRTRVLGGRDVVDDVTRSVNEVTLDHKLPMKRWNEETSKQQTNYQDMTEDDIRERFQLLKKSNGNVSHNLLKSRACEVCFDTGRRGTPFGIRYFYYGGDRWEGEDDNDPRGCVGCGWYDIEAWRASLNRHLNG